MWRLWLVAGALLWALAMAQAQLASFPPGMFTNKAAREPAAGGGGTVTLDVNQSGNSYKASAGSTAWFNSTNTTTGTGPLMTVTAGNALVCAIVRGDSANDVAAGLLLTWDSAGTPQNMTQIVHREEFTNFSTAQAWGLLSPHTGNLQLHITATNTAADNFVGCVSFSGVNSTFGSAFPNTNTTTMTSTLNLTCTSASGHQVVGVLNGPPNANTMVGTQIYYDNVSGSLINGAADFIGGATPTVGSTGLNSTIIVCTDVSP